MSQEISSGLSESRVFPPSEAFLRGCGDRPHVASLDEYRALWTRSIQDPEGFWGEVARGFDWFTPFTSVLDWQCPDARWFDGGTLNACHNCVDRQVNAGHGDEVAIIWEGEPGWPSDASSAYAAAVSSSDRALSARHGHAVRHLTYRHLQEETARLANALRSLGVRKGDVVTLYMGMVPELAIAVLACARIGAAHSVIFGGFAAPAIIDRVADAQSRVIITCDGAWRRGSIVPLKANVDEACKGAPSVEHVIVLRRTGHDVPMHAGRDHWWHELVASQPSTCACEPMASEDLLFLLYTSGSTGKPKGMMHTTAGYLLWASFTHHYTFDYHVGEVYACVADIGWITGHSYIVYGPLANGATTLMFESIPTYPDAGRYWDLCQRHHVTQFYTSPTAIRTLMKFGPDPIKKYDLSSLRVLGTVGEPINPEAWRFFFEEVGQGRCVVVDTFWQTETGGHMITNLPGCQPMKPGAASLPMFGVRTVVVDMQSGQPIEGNSVEGVLCFGQPWPGIARSIYGDHQRYLDTYLKPYPGYYFTGDGCKRDKDGYIWITGRVDDVLNVSGHRLGTAEIESALVCHPACVEAAVVGVPHDIKGQGIFAYCILRDGVEETAELVPALKAAVRTAIGGIAMPDYIVLTPALPKTRSGKIMRRVLRKIACKETDSLGDTSTLADPSIVDTLIEKVTALYAKK